MASELISTLFAIAAAGSCRDLDRAISNSSAREIEALLGSSQAERAAVAGPFPRCLPAHHQDERAA